MSNLVKNIDRLIRARGLTDDELRQRAKLSRASYEEIKGGNLPSTIDGLESVAKVLDVPVDDLFETVRPLEHVRFRSNKDLRDRDQILVDVGRWFYPLSDLEHMLNDHRPFKLAGDHPDDPCEAARWARKTLERDESEPIDNIWGLLESAGIRVGEVKSPSKGFFGLSIADPQNGYAIVTNTWKGISVERWIFTAAHELGHLILHGPEYDPKQTDENKAREKDKATEQEADSFAGYFLLPDVAFEKEWRSSADLSFLERVMQIKKKFKVSYRTVLFRLSKKYPQWNVWGRFHFEYKRVYGKALSRITEPDPLPEEAFRGEDHDGRPSERLRALVYKATEQEQITMSRAAEILSIPLREMHSLLVSKANSK